jgi:hypothetical protein
MLRYFGMQWGNGMEYGEVTLSLGQDSWCFVIRMLASSYGFNSLNPFLNKAGVLDLTSYKSCTGEGGPDMLVLTVTYASVVPVIGAAFAIVRLVPPSFLLH